MIFQLQHDKYSKVELHTCSEYAWKIGLRIRYLDQLSKYTKNPGEEASGGEKPIWGNVITRYGVINISVCSVDLCGLMDTYQRCDLESALPSEDRPHQPLHRTLMEIMMGSSIDGVQLWQVVISSESGSWKGNYPNGKGCTNHQDNATSWDCSWQQS
jgi:hypothetical protein